MSRHFIVLCESQLETIMKPENISTPQADPAPIVAGHVLGTYASAEIAEKAIIDFNCPKNHYIVEAMRFNYLSNEDLRGI